ncbi:PTS system, sucrose-specific IIC component [Pelagirhabdus alkalitolerans]|uniref:PTS system, sucrose-specific IIC component n=1 Tax=Pelagirhabdus alkalitolerans TaxID=1612202 RepID=A0A1G6KBI3_9BACI|nr:PTS transporter subunit EIIC [Pelagirhabdus alkalitolerans]SDC28191.1 PTS system, sucrose-specific IIC component [Pelagirhabdus alkalitolerans]
MQNEKTIKKLLEVVGGKDNIKNYEHCATRLRIILKDDSKLDKEATEEIPENKGYFFNTGQHQFIFGTGKVNEVHADLKEEMGDEDESSSSQDGDFKDDVYQNLSPVQRVVRTLADILVPLIPALVTTGLLMGVRGLLVELGMEFDDTWFAIFEMLTDTAFAFLPVLIAYSATRKFGGNPIIGIVVGLMMVAPQLPNAWVVAEGDADPMNVLGIPVVGYQGSIIPAIVAGYLISKLEKNLRKVVPQMMDLVVTPFVSLTVTITVMLLVLGPILQTVESGVINSIVYLIEAPLGIGYIVYGALQQVLVITGLHHSLSIIEISLIDDTGFNVLNTLGTASMAGQFGAAIATAMLMKNKVKKSNALSSSASTLFGITEPLLFGVNLRHIRIFASGMIGGAAGGLLTYIFGLAGSGLGITFIPGLLLYTHSIAAFIQYFIVIALAFGVSFVLVRAQAKAIREEVN